MICRGTRWWWSNVLVELTVLAKRLITYTSTISLTYSNRGTYLIETKAIDNAGNFMAILIPSLIAAIIAGLTIGGKAMFKKVAIRLANQITLTFAKFINIFTRKD